MKFLSLLLIAVTVAFPINGLINEEVSRVIDLKANIVKVSTSVTLKNDGDSPVSSFDYVVDPIHSKNLAYISIGQEGEEDENSKFKLKDKVSEKKTFSVTLPDKLKPSASVKLVVEEVFADCVTPFPKEISQSQNQLVVYRGNHVFYSAYKTVKQTTTVDLPSSTVESYTKYGNPSKDGSSIKYGDAKEFDNVAPFSQNGMKLHYENNNPFLAVTKLMRVIEVSHWGNIAVEEHIEIRHTGAKLKGSFSRYDYQRQPNSGASSVKSFKTILPASAADVYYRDEIGNISTSNLLETEESVDFEIRPRFPLFGGWKTYYYIGYNLPSYNYLYSRGDMMALKMRFVDHIMDDQIVDDFTLKVILPEGAKNVGVSLPYPAERQKDQLHFTYLDTVGRPVVIIKNAKLVEQHIDDFTLTYTFNRLLLLQEPLLIVGAFFLLFFTVIIIVRLDFSIAHDKMSEARMRVQGVLEQVQAQQARRDGCYQAYEAAVTKYKSSKDHSAFSISRKAIEKDHKDATNVIAQLLVKLRDDASDAADKGGIVLAPKRPDHHKAGRAWKKGGRTVVSFRSKGSVCGQEPVVRSCGQFYAQSVKEYIKQRINAVVSMNSIDASLKDKISQSIQLAEKLVQKRMTREQYLEHDGKCHKAIDEMKQKIAEITDYL